MNTALCLEVLVLAIRYHCSSYICTISTATPKSDAVDRRSRSCINIHSNDAMSSNLNRGSVLTQPNTVLSHSWYLDISIRGVVCIGAGVTNTVGVGSSSAVGDTTCGVISGIVTSGVGVTMVVTLTTGAGGT